MRKKRIFFVVVFIAIPLAIYLAYQWFLDVGFGTERPKYSKTIIYRYPDWLSNEEVVYVKGISIVSHYYGYLAVIGNMGTVAYRNEGQICAFNIKTKEERVIFKILRKFRRGVFIGSEPEQFGHASLGSISANSKDKLILFVVSSNKVPGIYTMDYEGKNIKKIDEEGYPKWSPDGSKILYATYRRYENPKYAHIEKNYASEKFNKAVSQKDYYLRESILWVMNKDGRDKKKILTTDKMIVRSSWHPDGQHILFGYHYHIDPKKYIISLAESSVSDTSLYPGEFSPDGKYYFEGGSVIYDFETGKTASKIKLTSDNKWSPDGTKIVGTYNSGNIAVVNADGTNFEVLREEYSDYRERDKKKKEQM